MCIHTDIDCNDVDVVVIAVATVFIFIALPSDAVAIDDGQLANQLESIEYK